MQYPHSIGAFPPEQEQTVRLQVSHSGSWSAEGVESFLWSHKNFEPFLYKYMHTDQPKCIIFILTKHLLSSS